MHKLTISIAETGKILSLGRSTIYELIDKGELVAVKFGRRKLVTVDSIKTAIKARTGNSLEDEVFAA